MLNYIHKASNKGSVMDHSKFKFNRVFSMPMYKNMKIKLGEMSFSKDFISDTRGDLYPVRKKSADCAERIEHGKYILEGGEVSRMICRHFPFASYEVTFSGECGEAGFLFDLCGIAVASVTVCGGDILYSCGETKAKYAIPSALVQSENTLIISCRPGAFDIYLKINKKPEFVQTIHEDAFKVSNMRSVFSDSYTFLKVSGNVTVLSAVSYIDNGISIADIRPIKYENGDVICERGRICFTASVRLQEGAFCGIFSWLCGTAEFELTGAVFYDCGDGVWHNYLAPVIIYNRDKKNWTVWVSSFEHKHILACGIFDGDPRFGINVIDVHLMEEAKNDSDISEFLGFRGDEDPDLYYDADTGRWLLAICRLDPATRSYVYVFFESYEPTRNFKYIGRGHDGAETGGSFVKINGELCFVCGNDFNKTSEYRIYRNGGVELAEFNYPDGGFRGWGSVFPVSAGSRVRYYWLTFDRHNGSRYNWSYGNLYCFEMI